MAYHSKSFRRTTGKLRIAEQFFTKVTNPDVELVHWIHCIAATVLFGFHMIIEPKRFLVCLFSYDLVKAKLDVCISFYASITRVIIVIIAVRGSKIVIEYINLRLDLGIAYILIRRIINYMHYHRNRD